MPTPSAAGRKAIGAAPKNCWCGATAKATPRWCRIFLRRLPSISRICRHPPRLRQFTAAADLIARANHVFCLGLRSSFSVAYMFHYIRSLFGANSVLVDGSGGIGIDALRAIGRDDVLLAISVKPYVSHSIDAAKYARSQRTRIIAVTDSEMSPLARLADTAILVRTETPSFFHTMTPAFAAVECLAALVAARRGPAALAGLEASEKQLAAFNTYLQPRSTGRRQT